MMSSSRLISSIVAAVLFSFVPAHAAKIADPSEPAHTVEKDVCPVLVHPKLAMPVRITPVTKSPDRLARELRPYQVPPYSARFFFDDTPPLADEVWAWGGGGGNTTSIAKLDLDREATYAWIPHVLGAIPGKTMLLFGGNGMYLPYLVAKSFARGTPLEDHFVFLPVSRGIAGTLANKTGTMDAFFDLMGIDRWEGNIAVIDTTVDSSKANGHEVHQSAQEVRRYLARKGRTAKQIQGRVIPYAFPYSAPSQSYAVSTYEKFLDRMGALRSKDVETGTPSFAVPMLYRLPPGQAGWTQHDLVMASHGAARWNAKFSRTADGFPQGTTDLSKEKGASIATHLQQRLGLANAYKKLTEKVAAKLEDSKTIRALRAETLLLQGYADFVIPKRPGDAGAVAGVPAGDAPRVEDTITVEKPTKASDLKDYEERRQAIVRGQPTLIAKEIPITPYLGNTVQGYSLGGKFPDESKVSSFLRGEGNRADFLDQLTFFLASLIEKKVYIGGLRPRDLLYGPRGIRVAGFDRVKSVKKEEEVLERLEEKFATHWKRYLAEEEITEVFRRLRLRWPKKGDAADGAAAVVAPPVVVPPVVPADGGGAHP